MRDNGFKGEGVQFRLDISKFFWDFFMMKVLKDWNSLPREVVDAPSPETFKISLDRTLSSLGLLKVSLLIVGGLD